MVRACLYLVGRRWSKFWRRPSRALIVIAAVLVLAAPDYQSIRQAVSGVSVDQWVQWGAILLGLIVLARVWLSGNPNLRPDLEPAETRFLFVGPLSYRQILHYSLLKSQPGISLTALALAVFGAVIPIVHPLYCGLGWVFVGNVARVHYTLAGVVQARRRPWDRRTIWYVVQRVLRTFLFVILLGFLVMNAFIGHDDAEMMSMEDRLRWLLDETVLYFILYPLRALGLLLVSRDAATFLFRLAPVLGMLAVLYYLLMAFRAPIEEAALEAARRTVSRDGGKAKRPNVPLGTAGARRLPELFRLRSHATPLTALIWKNLALAARGGIVEPSSRNASRRRPLNEYLQLGGVAVALVCLGTMMGFLLGAILAEIEEVAEFFEVAASLSILSLLATYGLVSAMRIDLREDFACIALLKSVPLSGWDVIVAELAAPLIVLGAGETLFCAGCLTGIVISGQIGAGMAISVAVSILIGWLAITALWLLVEQGMVLYCFGLATVPGGWIRYAMIRFAMLALLLLAPLGLAAGASAFLIYFVSEGFVSLMPLLVAATIAFVVSYEFAWGVRILARKYERLDPSDTSLLPRLDF